ncbi:hypothetical protein PTKIN_Ptkin01aG0318700 [Pterospermum kingtungense]
MSTDEINKLPDDVLIKILSFLTIKQAVRTSVLSSRWKQLWQFFSGPLNFSCRINYRLKLDLLREKLKSQSSRFVEQVNKVLNSHQGPSINKLRLHFHLDEDLGSYIDTWINIALKKKVKKLELINFPFVISQLRPYSFSQETFSCTTNLFLSSLSIENLGVSDETVNCILSSCPLLKSLEVSESPQLRDPKFLGSSLRLKYLSISYCDFIQSIEVCAPKLVSFKYSGREIPLHIRDVPKLKTLDYFSRNVNNPNIPLAFSKVSDYYLPRLVTLMLRMPFERMRLQVDKFPKFMSLKNLICTVGEFNGESLLFLTSLIEAAPFLNKFRLEVEGYNEIKRICKLRKLRTVKGHPNRYLKEVFMSGFCGREADAEIVTYLLKSAFMLKSIVIRVWLAGGKHIPEAKRKKAEDLARQLVQKNRPGAELLLK